MFSSREQAGHQLGQHLLATGVLADIVLGLPRGGVVVAAEVARLFSRPVEVLVVRKIGHPRHREFAVGALAESAVVVLDQDAMAETQVQRAELDKVIAEETLRLRDYQAKFHPSGLPELAARNVVIVDDGLATGATAEAAVLAAKERNAVSVVVAAPVASPSAVSRLSRVADQVIVLVVDPGFMAVGQYYASFLQVTDEEVLALLPAHARTP
jgi:putative phosphoribosyl transferase